jgi:hypothetical protein
MCGGRGYSYRISWIIPHYPSNRISRPFLPDLAPRITSNAVHVAYHTLFGRPSAVWPYRPPALRPCQASPTAREVSGSRAPSSAGSSIRPPSPGFARDSAGRGVSRRVQAVARVPRARTRGSARSGTRRATIPGEPATVAPPAALTRCGAREPRRSAAALG